MDEARDPRPRTITTPFGAWAVIGIVAMFCLAVEGLSMWAGAPGAGAVVVALISVMMLLRASLLSTGLWSAYLAAFTLPWNGYQIGPVRFGDLLILVSLACFAAAQAKEPLPRIPAWVAQLGFVTFLVMTLHEMVPTDLHYLSQRVVVDATGQPTIEIQTNLGVGVKLLIAVVGVSLALSYAVRYSPAAPRRLVVGYGLGAGLSGFIAFTDSKGLTGALGDRLTHNTFTGDRTAGLSDHPNFLAAACALSVPVAIWLISQSHGRTKMLGALMLALNLMGVYASGSRGGAVGAAAAIVLTLVVLPPFRAYLPTLFFAGAFVVVASYAVFPEVAHAVLKATRLTGGGVSTSGSDEVRALVGQQGINDFRFSPFDGVGLQVGAEAQNVYLQELASGGVLLFASMVIYWGGGIIRAWQLRERHPLARTLAVSLVVAETLNVVGASLTDRFMYLQIGVVAALSSQLGTAWVTPESGNSAQNLWPAPVDARST